MAAFSGIDPQSLLDLRRKGDCELIDVRTEQEVLRGTIEGARHIPLQQLPQRFNEIGRDLPVVFYCQSGARSMQASLFLSARGWTQVYNLDGGVIAWTKSGLPLAAHD